MARGRKAAPRALAVGAVTAAFLVMLTACSSQAGPAASATPAARWAGSVCASASTLDGSLATLTARIPVTESSRVSTLTQAKHEMRARADAVVTDVAAFSGAIASAPSPAAGQVRAARQELAGIAGRWTLAAARLTAAVAAWQAARTPAQFAREVAAGTAAVDAASGAGSMHSAVRRYLASRDQGLRGSFGVAPPCSALANSGF